MSSVFCLHSLAHTPHGKAGHEAVRYHFFFTDEACLALVGECGHVDVSQPGLLRPESLQSA